MIKKRYTDFTKLRTVLTDVFYYKIVPVLPPKNFRSKFQKQKDFFHERASGLKRFLQLVITDPDMFGLKTTRDFFTDENEFNLYYDLHYGGETQISKIYKTQSKFFSSAFQTVKSMTGLAEKKKFQIEAKDVKFVKMEQEIDHLKSFLSNHLENVIELKKGFQGLKSNYSEVLGMLKETEAEEDSDENWDSFSEEEEVFRESSLTVLPEDFPEMDPNINKLRGKDSSGIIEESAPLNKQMEMDQKFFHRLAMNLKETLADVEACKASLEIKDKIYEKFNYLQNLNLRDLKYDEKKLMQHQIISHEIKVLDNKSKK